MAVKVTFPRQGARALVILAILGLIAVVAMATLPQATITIHAKVASRKISQDILLSSKATGPDYIHYILPAKIVSQEGTAQQQFSQSSDQISQGNSKGVVTFTNNQDTEQRLLPKTHLRYEPTGVLFTTDSPLTIPPKGTVDAHVTAEQQGTSGDVAAGHFVIDKFSAGLQKAVYADSTTAFSGGEVAGNAISQQDIDTAKQTVLDAAKQKAMDALKQQTNNADIRSDLLSIQTEQDDVSVQAGSHAVSYTATAKVQARGFIVDSHDIVSLMTLALRASVAPDEEFSSYDPASFNLSIAQTDWTSGQARIAATLTGMFTKKIGSTELSEDNLAGLGKQELINHFKNFPSIGNVDVNFWPFWVTSTPSNTNKITIEVAH